MQRNHVHYKVGELHEYEAAEARGFVRCVAKDNDLCMDHWGRCRDRGIPFIATHGRVAFREVEYDLTGVLECNPNLSGLTDGAMERINEVAALAISRSARRRARKSIGADIGTITGLLPTDANDLATALVEILTDPSSYEDREIWEAA